MLHYLVFKVQLFEYDVLFLTIRKNASFGILTNILRTGGDEENRTPDPLLARQVLSQLSYTPILMDNE